MCMLRITNCFEVMAQSIPRPPILPPWAFFKHLSSDSKIVANAPQWGQLTGVYIDTHGGASERVQMTNLQNKITIIVHKLMYFVGSVIHVAQIAF